MMPSSSQVLDHQLIFHIMYGLGQFHHRQNKGEERRWEIWQKKQQLLSKHRAAADGVCCTAIGVLVYIKTTNGHNQLAWEEYVKVVLKILKFRKT